MLQINLEANSHSASVATREGAGCTAQHILRRVANMIAEGETFLDALPLYDENGNRIGAVSLEIENDE